MLDAISKAWDEQLSVCEICPTRCVSEKDAYCTMFEDKDLFKGCEQLQQTTATSYNRAYLATVLRTSAQILLRMTSDTLGTLYEIDYEGKIWIS